MADAGGFERGLTESKEIYPDMMTYETWLKNGKAREPQKGWNRLSLWNIIVGRKTEKL